MLTALSTKNQNVRQQLRATFDDFRSERRQWESEVTQFFGDFDALLESNPAPNAIVTGEASHVVEDIAGLRSLVEQQTDVLTALVNALAGESSTPMAVPPQTEDTDEVVEAFFDRVEQLQQVAANGDLT